MEKSVKRIVKIVNDIADAHKQIRGFGQGDVFEINIEERKMPLLWMDFTPSVIGRNRMNISFNLYAMDLVDQGDIQQLDVHSDTILYLNDVIKQLRTTYQLIDENRTFNVTPFEHSFNDDVSGWFTEVTLDLENLYGPCDIPTSLTPFSEDVPTSSETIDIDSLTINNSLTVGDEITVNNTKLFNKGKEQTLNTDSNVSFGDIQGNEISGQSYKLNRTAVSQSSYTLSLDEHLIGVDSSNNEVILNLPDAGEGEYEFIIKDEGYNASQNNIILKAFTANTFGNGATNVKLHTDGSSVTVYLNGNNKYYII